MLVSDCQATAGGVKAMGGKSGQCRAKAVANGDRE